MHVAPCVSSAGKPAFSRAGDALAKAFPGPDRPSSAFQRGTKQSLCAFRKRRTALRMAMERKHSFHSSALTRDLSIDSAPFPWTDPHGKRNSMKAAVRTSSQNRTPRLMECAFQQSASIGAVRDMHVAAPYSPCKTPLCMGWFFSGALSAARGCDMHVAELFSMELHSPRPGYTL